MPLPDLSWWQWIVLIVVIAITTKASWDHPDDEG